VQHAGPGKSTLQATSHLTRRCSGPATAPSNRSMVLFGIQLGAPSHPASGPAAERQYVRPHVSGFPVSTMTMTVGSYSIACRLICSAFVFWPLVYRILGEDGDVYHFLVLVLLSPLAGCVLLLNSLYCLFRYRTWKSAVISSFFIPVSVIGAVVAWHYLPQFRM
jgi:hypothetical protein